jgi:metal-dependent amidase/aminoacylase/carboxypeptidase family protein
MAKDRLESLSAMTFTATPRFEEVLTAALVAEWLRAWGLGVTQGIARTGVVVTLQGRRPGQRAIGLRADLDALHIQEVPGRAYGSVVPGKRHACGISP